TSHTGEKPSDNSSAYNNGEKQSSVNNSFDPRENHPYVSNISHTGEKPDMVDIMLLNCRSLNANQDSFQLVVDSSSPDIIIGTESWLNSSIGTQEVFPNDY